MQFWLVGIDVAVVYQYMASSPHSSIGREDGSMMLVCAEETKLEGENNKEFVLTNYSSHT
jgi:hypothetical protein